MNTHSRSMVGFRGRTLLLALQLGGMATAHAAAASAAPDGSTAPAASAPAAATTQSAPTTKKEEPLQEVVVVGMRANLEKSLDVKKLAPVVLDSINSTELGRFPDDDVADSLAHLPGITIERTTGGEGQKISVRGLGPEFNM